MPVSFDASGALTTIACDTALTHWDATIEAVLAHAATASSHLAATLAADPNFALGHACRGLVLLTLARAELRSSAAEALATARRLDAENPVGPRERCHIDALASWLAGDPATAAQHLDRAITLDPRDALAAKLAHAIRFMMGDQRGLLVAARRHLASYGQDGLHSGYLTGCLAFAHEENHDYAMAERLGRTAIAMTPRDAWARHSVAHVMEMTGRTRQGLDWLADGRAHWSHCSNFGFHLAWHQALFHLELGNEAAALALYDVDIRASHTDDYRDIANAASLLQRLELAGVAIGNRWEELADLATARIHDRTLVFADLHYALALLGAGRPAQARELFSGLASDPASSHDGRLARQVGALLGAGLIAFQARRFGEALELLLKARPLAPGIGGSDAQRDIFEQMLIESAIRAGEIGLAHRLLDQRLAARGGNNRFASQRLTRLAPAGTPLKGRIAAALAALAPSPALH